MRKRWVWGRVAPTRGFFRQAFLNVLVRKAVLSRVMACSLFILDKGKPVARPVRKAMGRRIFPAEAWLPNGCERFSSASGGEEVFYLPS